MKHYSLKKLIVDRYENKIYNLTFKVNNGQPTQLPNKTSYDSNEKELIINLDDLENSESYQVTDSVDFAIYPNKYHTLKTILIEDISSERKIEYNLIELNINDTNYPPPRARANEPSELKFFKNLLLQQELIAPVQSQYSIFSGTFIVERLTLEIKDNDIVDLDIELKNTSSNKHYIINGTPLLCSDLYRGGLVEVIVLQVSEVQTPPPTPTLVYPTLNIPLGKFKNGLSIIITDTPLSTPSNWKNIDTKKAYLYI